MLSSPPALSRPRSAITLRRGCSTVTARRRGRCSTRPFAVDTTAASAWKTSSLSPTEGVPRTTSSSSRSRRRVALRVHEGSPRPADGPHLPAAASSAEEPIAAVGLEPRHACARRHVERFQDLSRSRVDAPQVALVPLPGAVPELSVGPGDAGDEAVGLDGAENRTRLGIDLMDLPLAVLPHPERPFGPRQSGVSAAAGRRDRGQYAPGLRIDL